MPTDAIALMPPEARLHEPPVALDGGPDGLAVLRRVAGARRDWLAPGGHLLVETSDDQADALRAALTAVGLRPAVLRDDERDAIAVTARRPG